MDGMHTSYGLGRPTERIEVGVDRVLDNVNTEIVLHVVHLGFQCLDLL